MSKIEYDMTMEDLVEFNLYNATESEYGKRGIRRFRILVGSIAVVTAVLMVVRFHQGATAGSFISLMGIYVLIFIPFLIFYPMYLKWHVRRTAAKAYQDREMPTFGGTRTLELSDEGIEESNEDGSNTVPWDKIESIDETETHVFIFIGPVQAAVIPKARVRGDLDAFANEVRRRIGGSPD